MNLTELKKNGFKIVTNWQECYRKSIFIFNSNNFTSFVNYRNLAIKKKLKKILLNIFFIKIKKI